MFVGRVPVLRAAVVVARACAGRRGRGDRPRWGWADLTSIVDVNSAHAPGRRALDEFGTRDVSSSSLRAGMPRRRSPVPRRAVRPRPGAPRPGEPDAATFRPLAAALERQCHRQPDRGTAGGSPAASLPSATGQRSQTARSHSRQTRSGSRPAWPRPRGRAARVAARPGRRRGGRGHGAVRVAADAPSARPPAERPRCSCSRPAPSWCSPARSSPTAFVGCSSTEPVSTVATYAYVNPVVALGLGWALLGESLSATMAAGERHRRRLGRVRRALELSDPPARPLRNGPRTAGGVPPWRRREPGGGRDMGAHLVDRSTWAS